ncbi:MAG: NADH-quinone oxidoreductase chain 5 [Holosporales bacterium]
MKNFIDALLFYVEADVLKYEYVYDTPCIHIASSNLIRILTILRDHSPFKMEQLVDIVGVDYPDEKKRFTIIYHLLSHEINQRLFVKVQTALEVPSITGVFKSADWHEREVYDMFGVIFTDHPDLRRILTDYNFDGYPLRKDFPLSGYTEVYYNQEAQKVDYQTSLIKERSFDFISPWEGNQRK